MILQPTPPPPPLRPPYPPEASAYPTDTHTLAYLSPYIDLLVLCTASPLGLLCTRQYSLVQLSCTSV
jgi:hypothetical protein